MRMSGRSMSTPTTTMTAGFNKILAPARHRNRKMFLSPSPSHHFLTAVFILFTFLHGFVVSSRDSNSNNNGNGGGCENFSSSLSPEHLSIECHLRSLNGAVFDKRNLSIVQGEEDSVVSLDIFCSQEFYPSSLPSDFFSQNKLNLKRLAHLNLQSCKFSHLPKDLFKELHHLRNLTLNSHNTHWASSLDISPEVFSSPPNNNLQIESVDFSFNNIFTIQEGLFCPLSSLIKLNMSHNRIQDLSDFNFHSNKDSSKNTLQCKLPIQNMDMSNNRLIVLHPDGLSSLSELEELYFQKNEISVVGDGAFSGLKGLKTLNLIGNKIVALPQNLFEDTSEITEIYLTNNSISHFPPKIFHKLSQLLIFESSNNLITSLNNTTTGLIRLVSLNLAYNRLTKLDPSSFQDLYSLQILNLENNQIQFIDGNTFSSMNNLHTLMLSYNKLSFIDSTAFNGLYVLSLLSLDNNELSGMDKASLQNCSSLKDLNLNGNLFSTVPEAIQNLTLLKTVDLGENQIEQIQSPRLIGLPNLYGLRLTGNRISNITKDVLKDLFSLKIFNGARNWLKSVEAGSFNSNKNLQAIRLDANYLSNVDGLFSIPSLIFLNISDNHLVTFDYSAIPPQLQWLDIHKNYIEELINNQHQGLKLQTLDASFNKLNRVSSEMLPDSLENLFLNNNQITKIDPHTFYAKTALKRVDLFENEIETFDLSSLRLHPIPLGRALPEFYLGNIICNCKTEWLQRINKLEHLRQYPRIVDLESVICKVPHRGDIEVPLLQNKNFLCPYVSHCFALCTCCEFGFCDCAMTCPMGCTCFHDDTWNSNIVDCSSRSHFQIPNKIPMDSTEIYLDGNHFKELSSHAFIGRKNLKALFLNGSSIARIESSAFSGLKRLSILHLENNFINELYGYEFEPLEGIRELYLQHNQISSIANGTFSNLRILEVLKLNGNRLTNFAFWTLNLNPYLVELSISDNPLSCECDYLSRSIPWIQSNLARINDAMGVSCVKPNGKSIPLFYISMNGSATSNHVKNKKFCSEITALSGYAIEGRGSIIENEEDITPTSTYLLAGVMAICLVFGSLLVVICKRRSWALAKGKCPLKCYSSGLDDTSSTGGGVGPEKLYDAYIAYSVKDEPWVSQILASELNQSKYSLKLCLHYKDFPVTSAYLADTIVEAVESSKRTIIVLSSNFILTEWNKFDFRSALHTALSMRDRERERSSKRKNNLIVITLGEINSRDFDVDLRVCLRSATVLNSSDKQFWAKLKAALPSVPVSSSMNVNSNTTNTNTNTLSLSHPHSQHHHQHQQQSQQQHLYQHPNNIILTSNNGVQISLGLESDLNNINNNINNRSVLPPPPVYIPQIPMRPPPSYPPPRRPLWPHQ